MVENKERLAVWFNDEQLRLFEELTAAHKTTQGFSDFVKSAFHEKVSELKQPPKHEDNEYIQKVAFEIAKKLSH